ncbi:hypothetical protein V8C34DRAFT_299033 [Trichoderma compactum]
MKSSRPAKGTKASGSKEKQYHREISLPRTRNRASRNRQNSQNASRSSSENSHSSDGTLRPGNETSQSSNGANTTSSRKEQNPQNIEAMAPSSGDQQEFSLPSEVEIKLLKQKYGTMRSTCDALEQRIAQLESENSLLKQEHGTVRSTCSTLEQRTRQLENGNRELKRETERETERLREEFNTFKLEHAWKVDHLWKRMNQMEQNSPGKESKACDKRKDEQRIIREENRGFLISFSIPRYSIICYLFVFHRNR